MTIFSKKDEKFMKLALALAEQNRNLNGYDPAVGCVIVKNGRVIATGSHAQVATAHAEEAALKKAGREARGASLYLNLEPCSHWGNNPPCAEAIVQAGIKKVFASLKDPNPLVNGTGFKILKKAGVEVNVGLLAPEAQKINEAFFKFIQRQIPFVTLKIAQSLDGKIATATGQSRWITGLASRKQVHYLRSVHRAIMVGTNTVLKDNPFLTVRYLKVKYQPLRLVLDAFGRIPLNFRVFDRTAATLLVVSEKYPAQKLKAAVQRGIEIVKIPQKKGIFNLRELLRVLGAKKIASLMVEGGAELIGSFVDAGLADKLIIFLAPVVIGSQASLSAVGGAGAASLKKAWRLKEVTYKKLGEDWLVAGYF